MNPVLLESHDNVNTDLTAREKEIIVFVSHDGKVYPSGFLPVEVGSVRERPIYDVKTSHLFTSLTVAASRVFRVLAFPVLMRKKDLPCIYVFFPQCPEYMRKIFNIIPHHGGIDLDPYAHF